MAKSRRQVKKLRQRRFEQHLNKHPHCVPATPEIELGPIAKTITNPPFRKYLVWYRNVTLKLIIGGPIVLMLLVLLEKVWESGEWSFTLFR